MVSYVLAIFILPHVFSVSKQDMVYKIKRLTVVGIDRSKAETDEKSQKKELSRKCHNCPPEKPHFTANPS